MKNCHVFKYKIEDQRQQVALPVGAQVLDFQPQDKDLYFWALVEPDKPLELRSFFIVGTGEPFSTEKLTYVATCQHGPFVWHLFEEAT